MFCAGDDTLLRAGESWQCSRAEAVGVVAVVGEMFAGARATDAASLAVQAAAPRSPPSRDRAQCALWRDIVALCDVTRSRASRRTWQRSLVC
jgi:hypothetical protein